MKRSWAFGPFTLDENESSLHRCSEHISLPPKAFSVLCYLVQHHGHLVVKNELIDAIWPRGFVDESALKVCINELRKALGDNPKTPCYIETVFKKGYRFIAKVDSSKQNNNSESDHSHGCTNVLLDWCRDIRPEDVLLRVGRCNLLGVLDILLLRATEGQRTIVFLTGEAGIGKSTVVEMFLDNVSEQNIGLLHGQCIDHYGTNEALFPLLEAISKPIRNTCSLPLIKRIKAVAPTWLEQMPWLLSSSEREELRRETLGASKDRMLREFCELIDGMSLERPLILLLEDLHWSDFATLDFLSLFAHQRTPSSILIIGTLRPLEVKLKEHPIATIINYLQMHGLCTCLSMDTLNLQDVNEYIERRFPEGQAGELLSPTIYRRSGGNPLFMVNLVEHVFAQGGISKSNGNWIIDKRLSDIEVGMPDNLRAMIDLQIDRLDSSEKRLLKVASAVGLEFTAHVLSGALECDYLDIESICDALVRRGHMLRFVEDLDLPDGSRAGKYAFLHALYAEVLYQQLSSSQRTDIHGRLGETLERMYAINGNEVAPEIAHHFEENRNFKKAVRYLSHSALRATQHYANREALNYLQRALQLIDRLQITDQTHTKIELIQQRVSLKRSIYDMIGAKEDLELILSLAREISAREIEVTALLELAGIYFWTDCSLVLELVESAVEIANVLGDEFLLTQAKCSKGYWNIHLVGWTQPDEDACLAGLDSARRAGNDRLIGIRLSHMSVVHCYHGRYHLAYEFAEEAMKALIGVGGEHYHYMVSQHYYVWAKLHAGDLGGALRILSDYIDLAQKNDNRLAETSALIALSWVNAECGQFKDALFYAQKGLQSTHGLKNLSPYCLGRLMLGKSLLGLCDYTNAFECFDEILSRIRDESLIIEPPYHLLLHRGLTEYWFVQNNWGEARNSAHELCRLASLSDERTYLAIGYAWLAEIAYQEGNKEGALQSIFSAIDTLSIETDQYPLAAWRIFAKAAELSDRLDRKTEAKVYRERSAVSIIKLADSIFDDVSRREAFLATPQAQIALGKQEVKSKYIPYL